MPAGELVTVPAPLPDAVTVSVYWLRKIAVTFVAAVWCKYSNEPYDIVNREYYG